jgi:hypothetical protein
MKRSVIWILLAGASLFPSASLHGGVQKADAAGSPEGRILWRLDTGG